MSPAWMAEVVAAAVRNMWGLMGTPSVRRASEMLGDATDIRISDGSAVDLYFTRLLNYVTAWPCFA